MPDPGVFKMIVSRVRGLNKGTEYTRYFKDFKALSEYMNRAPAEAIRSKEKLQRIADENWNDFLKLGKYKD